MVAHIKTVSFQGLDVQTVEVQVLMTSGLPNVNIVGLPERAVGESKERVRGALASLGLMQPPAHVSINLAPADLSKEGTHFDLPIVLALLVEMEVLPPDCLDGMLAMGELGLELWLALTEKSLSMKRDQQKVVGEAPLLPASFHLPQGLQ